MYTPFYLKGAATILSAALLIFLTNTVSPDILGRYFFILSIVLLLNSLLTNGLAKYLLRSLASDSSVYRTIQIKGVITRVSFLVAGMSVAMWLITDSHWTALVSFCLVPSVFIALSSSYLRANGQLILGNFEGTIWRPTASMILMAACVFLGQPLTPEVLIFILGLTLWVSAIVLYFYLAFELQMGSIRNYLNSREKVKSVIFLSLVGGYEFMLVNAESAALGLVSSPEQVAIFKVCLIFKTLIMMPVIAANMFLPYFMSSGNESEQDLTRSLSFIGFLVGALILGANFIFGEVVVVLLFGEAYTSVSELINWFIIAVLGISLFGGQPEKLVANYGESKYFVVGLVVLGFDLVLIFLLGPSMGAKIAVVNTAIATSCICIFATYFNNQISNIKASL